MTAREQIQDFLGLRRFAVAGVSRQPGDFSRSVLHEFLVRGYEAVPVNPQAEEIDGQRCFAHVTDIQPPVDGVLIMTAAERTPEVVRECAAAGVTRVWMFRGGGQGAVNPEAIQFCDAHGISVIPGECPFMFLPHSAWFHGLHGLIRRITGSYPR